MATITPPTQPRYWMPSGNPIVYSISTTNTMPRLHYIIEVIINGSSACKLKYAVYDRNNMDFDFRNIVNDYISSTFVNDEPGFNIAANETLKLELKVSEQYFDTNSNSWVTGTATPVKGVFIWYAAAPFQDSRQLWTYNTKNDLHGSSYNYFGRFLGVHNYVPDVCLNTAGSPAVGNQILFHNLYKVGLNTRRTMDFFTNSYYNGSSKHTMIFQCWCYNRQHQLTKRFSKEIHNGTISLADYQKRIGVVPVGVFELNNFVWDNTIFGVGSIPFIDTKEDKYYFLTVCGYNSQQSQILQLGTNTPQGNKWVGFEIEGCNNYDVFNVLYETREGGWWQIRCDRKHHNSTDVKTSVKFNPWKYKAQTTLPNDAIFKQTTHTDANGTIILNTDWLENQGVISEIEDMIVSPRIYLVKDGVLQQDPVYIPVILKDAEHDIYEREQDKLIRYEFEFEEAYKKATLR